MSTAPKADELFDRSSMTFGEHLEELRKCLFKAAYGLALAFIIGLLFGNDVVKFIQRPLSKALYSYIQKETSDRLAKEGMSSEAIEDRVQTKGLLREEVFIDPAAILPELKKSFPEQFKNVELPKKDTSPKPEIAESQSQGVSLSPDASSAKDPATVTPAVADTAVPADSSPEMIRVLLWHPGKDDARTQIKSLNAQEPFTVYVKASLLVGILLSSPWIFFQLWSFVAAGLYPHERHYVHFYLPFSIGLFLLGAGLAFFVVFEPVLNFLLSFNRMTGIAPEMRINEWLSFVLWLPVGFGVGFQLPLVMLFLERVHIFTIEGYLKQWRIAVLCIFVIAALLTPPDPYSMTLMALPLTILYFGGILLCKYLPHHESSTDLVPLD